MTATSASLDSGDDLSTDIGCAQSLLSIPAHSFRLSGSPSGKYRRLLPFLKLLPIVAARAIAGQLEALMAGGGGVGERATMVVTPSFLVRIGPYPRANRVGFSTNISRVNIAN